MAVTLSARRQGQTRRAVAFAVVTLIFLYTTVANVVERPDGVKIASFFIASIIATSIASAITQRKVRANTAMTGEITLRGEVLAIGGLKEKLLAAGFITEVRPLAPHVTLLRTILHPGGRGMGDHGTVGGPGSGPCARPGVGPHRVAHRRRDASDSCARRAPCGSARSRG